LTFESFEAVRGEPRARDRDGRAPPSMDPGTGRRAPLDGASRPASQASAGRPAAAGWDRRRRARSRSRRHRRCESNRRRQGSGGPPSPRRGWPSRGGDDASAVPGVAAPRYRPRVPSSAWTASRGVALQSHVHVAAFRDRARRPCRRHAPAARPGARAAKPAPRTTNVADDISAAKAGRVAFGEVVRVAVCRAMAPRIPDRAVLISLSHGPGSSRILA